MNDADRRDILGRIEEKIDSLVSTSASISERVARIEMLDISKLSNRVRKLELSIAESAGATKTKSAMLALIAGGSGAGVLQLIHMLVK